MTELGAAFPWAGLGMANAPRKDNAGYVAPWLKALKSDQKATFAASKAQHAADYLHGLQPIPLQASSRPGLSRRLPTPQRPFVRGPGLSPVIIPHVR